MPSGGIATIAGLGIGLGQTIYGAIAKKKAQDAANANVMPKYNIPQEEYDNLNLDESMAGQGMSAAARQQLLNNTNSSQAATLGAIEKGGGDVNTIGSVVDKTQNALNQNAIYDDTARMQHLSNLQAQRTRLSADKDKQWQINEYQPWANRAQAITGQLAGASNMEMAGINTAGKSVESYLGMLGKNKPITTGVSPSYTSMDYVPQGNQQPLPNSFPGQTMGQMQPTDLPLMPTGNYGSPFGVQAPGQGPTFTGQWPSFYNND